jgi:hypothetical protein
MNLEEEITNKLAEQIAQEIDFEFLTDILIACGWHKVVLQSMTYEHGKEIDQWVASQVKAKYKTMGLVWIFENHGEAVNFTLRWAN